MILVLAPALLLLAATPVQEVDPSLSLPVPPAVAHGEVPLSQPIAPVPTGLSPWAVSFSLLFGVADPFYGKVATWVTARRGFGALGLEVFGGKAFSWAGPALDVCSNPANCTTPSGSKLGATPGNLGFMGGLSGVWRAANGKVGLAGLGNIRFDMEFTLGAAALQYTVTENTEVSRVSPAARLSMALGASVASSLSLRLELQDLVYPTVIRGEHGVQNQFLAGASLAWLLGGR